VTAVAIDWSGAKKPAGRIWIAEAVDADSVSKTIAGSADVIVLIGVDRQ